jgi:hypothetical protein
MIDTETKTETNTEQYSLNPALKELERFYNYLNAKYSLKLPNKAIITIQTKGRRRAYGWFGVGFWDNSKEKGLNEINISAEYLTEGNPYETLAHEVAHYCELQRRGKLSKNNYHTETFKQFAEQLGLKVTKVKGFGYALTETTEQFNKMLLEFKPQKEVFDILRVNQLREKQRTKMHKWTCSEGCTIVRCATELNAKCDNCGQQFKEC